MNAPCLERLMPLLADSNLRPWTFLPSSSCTARMGKPEDFAGDQPQGETQKGQPLYNSSNKRKRVFRDPDNSILAGVCSGISNYFNIDPLWLRLILAVSFFLFGTGFLLYIILWIIIPEAKTAAEKLEMHGEDVNFSNIGKKVEEEMNSFGKKAEIWGEDVKRNASQTRGKAKDFVNQLLYFIGSVAGGFFRVFVKVVGVFIAIIGLVLLVAMTSSLFGGTGLVPVDGETFSIRDGYSMFFENEQQELLASSALLLFIGIPLIMLVFGGIKMLLGIKTKNRYVGMGAGILWLVGLVLVIVLTNQVAGQFAEEATSKQTVQLLQPKCDTLFLKVKGGNNYDGHERIGKYMRVKVKNHTVISADNINFRYPDLDIVRGETDSFEVVIYGEARGKDRKEALHLARNILYEVSQKDSLVEFMPHFSVPLDEKWRVQKVHIELRVPKGKMVYIERSMKGIIYDVKNETDTWDGDMTGRRWIMGTEELRCVDCDGIERNQGFLIEKTVLKVPVLNIRQFVL